MKILYVEDDLNNIRLMRRIAVSAGHELIIANTAAEGLRIATQSPLDSFQIVFMDMKLPDGDGFTLTREIRKHLPHTPIIAITAYAMEGDEEKCIAAGCTDYIPKPFLVDEMANKMHQYAQISSAAQADKSNPATG